VPLLYEVGGEERFDVVVAITAPEDVRRERSNVSSPEQRETRLIADDEKAARSDFSYVNDGTRQQLDDFVAETMRALEARQPA
jgi:dephospho-CoA kinase